MVAGYFLFTLPAHTEEVTPPPPMMLPQRMIVYKGETIDIPLQATGRTKPNLRFLIRSKPSRGSLSDIMVGPNQTAKVRYTHNPEKGLGPDSFSFAGQTLDSPVSASARVLIEVVERPPQAQMARALDFGTIQLGRESSRRFVLTNTGGGVLVGELRVPEPWLLKESGEYAIAAGEKREFNLTYRPETARLHQGTLRFSHDDSASVTLKGEAILPLHIEPARLAFQAGPNGERKALLRIRNESEEDRIVTITLPPAFEEVKEFTLALGTEEEIPLHLKPNHLSGWEGDLLVESAGFVGRIHCQIEAAAGQLMVNPEEGFDFGLVEPEKTVGREMIIRNTGGQNVTLRTAMPAEVRLEPVADNLVLSPGQEQKFIVHFTPEKPGPWKAEMILQNASNPPLKIGLKATVPGQAPLASAPPPPAIAAASVLPTTPENPGTSPEATPPPVWQPDSTNAPITSVHIDQQGENFVQLSWPLTAEEISNYRLEMRDLEFGKEGSAKTTWKPIPNVQLTLGQEKATALVQGLKPGQVLIARIVSITPTGEEILPGDFFRFSTKPLPPPKPFPWVWAMLAFILAVGLAGYRWFKKRQTSTDPLASRIKNLENP